MTFQIQAEKFLKDGATRKRNPLRPASLRTYRTEISKHLVPLIGELSLELVGNKTVKPLVQSLHEKGLSPATIQLNINLIKQIVSSAVDENGDQIYPRTWNSDFLDMPAVENQKCPTISQGALQKSISEALPIDQALYAILAGTGLRIAEALALTAGCVNDIGSFWAPEESKLVIRQQRGRDGMAPTKTKAGYREIDISEKLNVFLIKRFSGVSGLMFPDPQNTYRDRATKNGVPGFHSLRRFRITRLDSQSVPEGLKKFWAGHAAKDVTERYIKSGEEIELRKKHAAKAGLGFNLPEGV